MVPEVPLSLLVWQIDVSVMKYVLMGLCPSECVVESGLLVLSITMPTLTFSFSAFLLHIKLSSHLCSDIIQLSAADTQTSLLFSIEEYLWGR